MKTYRDKNGFEINQGENWNDKMSDETIKHMTDPNRKMTKHIVDTYNKYEDGPEIKLEDPNYAENNKIKSNTQPRTGPTNTKPNTNPKPILSEYEKQILRFSDPKAKGTFQKLVKADEKAYEDDFLSPYVGKVYQRGSTEIISMGLEWMYKNPVGFYEKDPDHFDLILRILKGVPNIEVTLPPSGAWNLKAA